MTGKDSLLNGGYSTPETYIYIRGLAGVDVDAVVEHIKEEKIDIDYTEEDSKVLGHLLKDELLNRLDDEVIGMTVFKELLINSIDSIDFNEVAEKYIVEVVEAVEEKE